MDYKKKYEEALETARRINNGDGVACPSDWTTCEVIFPELRESEDEKISKEIIYFLSRNTFQFGEDIDKYKSWITWLEKQGNKSVNIDIESMVNSYEQRLKSQGSVENSPLVNMCLTAFRHGVEEVLEELHLKKLEKQGEKPFDYESAAIVQQDFALIKQKPDDNEESTTQSYITPNQKFFQWIYDRLIHVHNENPNVDYMISLKERIKDMKESAWSEEDENIALSIEQVMNCASLLNIVPEKMDKIKTWLKSLKQRIDG